MDKSLYDAVVALGIEHDSHESDLYLPATQMNATLIEHHGFSKTTFRSNTDGGLWFDVPFAYAPFWRAHGCTV